MNINYGRIVNGQLEYAPSSLVTPAGVVVNPSAATYRKAGWLRVEPIPPPPDGYTHAISGYTWNDEAITPIVKRIPIENPPRTFSKLKLVTILTERNAPQMSEANRREAAQIAEQSSARAERSDRKGPRIWPAIRDWLDETGWGDFFIAAQTIREDHPAFKAALAESKSRFNFTDDQIAAVLTAAVSDDA